MGKRIKGASITEIDTFPRGRHAAARRAAVKASLPFLPAVAVVITSAAFAGTNGLVIFDFAIEIVGIVAGAGHIDTLVRGTLLCSRTVGIRLAASGYGDTGVIASRLARPAGDRDALVVRAFLSP